MENTYTGMDSSSSTVDVRPRRHGDGAERTAAKVEQLWSAIGEEKEE
jgi:hypothetical protein